MGRGRAKAKQTKVARQLKYSSGGTDLQRLQQELAGEHDGEPFDVAEDDADEDDDYAAYSEYAAVEDEDRSVGT